MVGGKDEGDDLFGVWKVFGDSWEVFADAVFVGGDQISESVEDFFVTGYGREWGEAVFLVFSIDFARGAEGLGGGGAGIEMVGSEEDDGVWVVVCVPFVVDESVKFLYFL